jgi:hypothetical protein
MLYERPEVFISLCTSAIWAETEAVGVPMGIRQKSAVHLGGVLMVWLVIFRICFLEKRTVEQLTTTDGGEVCDDIGLGRPSLRI